MPKILDATIAVLWGEGETQIYMGCLSEEIVLGRPK